MTKVPSPIEVAVSIRFAAASQQSAAETAGAAALSTSVHPGGGLIFRASAP